MAQSVRHRFHGGRLGPWGELATVFFRWLTLFPLSTAALGLMLLRFRFTAPLDIIKRRFHREGSRIHLPHSPKTTSPQEVPKATNEHCNRSSAFAFMVHGAPPSLLKSLCYADSVFLCATGLGYMLRVPRRAVCLRSTDRCPRVPAPPPLLAPGTQCITGDGRSVPLLRPGFWNTISPGFGAGLFWEAEDGQKGAKETGPEPSVRSVSKTQSTFQMGMRILAGVARATPHPHAGTSSRILSYAQGGGLGG